MILLLHSMLTELSSGIGPTGRIDKPTNYTSQSSSCLIALSVAKGDAELILNAIATLIMAPKPLAEQYILVSKHVKIINVKFIRIIKAVLFITSCCRRLCTCNIRIKK